MKQVTSLHMIPFKTACAVPETASGSHWWELQCKMSQEHSCWVLRASPDWPQHGSSPGLPHAGKTRTQQSRFKFHTLLFIAKLNAVKLKDKHFSVIGGQGRRRPLNISWLKQQLIDLGHWHTIQQYMLTNNSVCACSSWAKWNTNLWGEVSPLSHSLIMQSDALDSAQNDILGNLHT